MLWRVSPTGAPGDVEGVAGEEDCERGIAGEGGLDCPRDVDDGRT